MDKGFDEALQIANNKHDVIAIRVFDERETELPNIGLAKFKDAETGKTRWTDTSSSTVRRQYRQEHLDNEKYLRRTFLKSGVDVVNIRTDQDYVKQLIGLFKRREARA